jgi:hypothetical protein
MNKATLYGLKPSIWPFVYASTHYVTALNPGLNPALTLPLPASLSITPIATLYFMRSHRIIAI